VGNNHTKGQRASIIGTERQKGEEEEARKCQKKQKSKQQRRRREPEAPGEQEVREGSHQEGPQSACGSATARRRGRPGDIYVELGIGKLVLVQVKAKWQRALRAAFFFRNLY